jgi:hypothetical protein
MAFTRKLKVDIILKQTVTHVLKPSVATNQS